MEFSEGNSRLRCNGNRIFHTDDSNTGSTFTIFWCSSSLSSAFADTNLSVSTCLWVSGSCKTSNPLIIINAPTIVYGTNADVLTPWKIEIYDWFVSAFSTLCTQALKSAVFWRHNHWIRQLWFIKTKYFIFSIDKKIVKNNNFATQKMADFKAWSHKVGTINLIGLGKKCDLRILTKICLIYNHETHCEFSMIIFHNLRIW